MYLQLNLSLLITFNVNCIDEVLTNTWCTGHKIITKKQKQTKRKGEILNTIIIIIIINLQYSILFIKQAANKRNISHIIRTFRLQRFNLIFITETNNTKQKRKKVKERKKIPLNNKYDMYFIKDTVQVNIMLICKINESAKSFDIQSLPSDSHIQYICICMYYNTTHS